MAKSARKIRIPSFYINSVVDNGDYSVPFITIVFSPLSVAGSDTYEPVHRAEFHEVHSFTEQVISRYTNFLQSFDNGSKVYAHFRG